MMPPGPFNRLRGPVAWPRLLLAIAGCSVASATTFHVDPAVGTMSNPGTATQPWSTLEAVFAANKTFAAGDVILLESGFHGAPQVKGNNSAVVTIRPDDGAVPKLKNLIVKSGSRWVIAGLDICPENAGPGIYLDGSVVDIQSSCSDITLQDCTIRAALDTSAWSVADWQGNAASGILSAAPRTTITGNTINNVGFGIRIRKTAPNSLISRNSITDFYLDGMVGLGDDCTFEYNKVTGSHVDDTNHDDFFQSWSTGADGAGTGTIYRVTLRGNTFISRTDPGQTLPTEPQGIGCFDGMFEGWVIENNLIVTNTYHGISLYGAVDCKIVNNTVVENPLNTTTGKRPWIQIYQHGKDSAGNPWPAVSANNLIRNNISASTAIMVAGGGVIDHNQKTTAYTTWFRGYPSFDFFLASASPGIGAGEAEEAPAIDIQGVTRSIPYDLGAYAYATTPNAYQEWLRANRLPADGSGNGAPDANPSGDGVSNEMKFALGLPVDSPGYAGHLSAATLAVGEEMFLSLTYTYPEPAPTGVSYNVKVGSDLFDWTSGTTAEVGNAVADGFRTVTIRDTVPVGELGLKRFIRLEVTR